MSSFAGYLDTPTADIDELRAHFRPMFDKIAEANVERERDRGFPHEQVRLLNDAAFGHRANPVIRGGFGASLEQTFLLLADLGEADANISHIWRNHLAFVEDRLNAPVSDTNDVWMNRFLGGEFVGGGWTEANNLTLANLATTVTAEDDHFLVTGAKYYATGSLYADWLDVLGREADGELLTALVRGRRPGRHPGRRLAWFRAAHHRQRNGALRAGPCRSRGCVSGHRTVHLPGALLSDRDVVGADRNHPGGTARRFVGVARPQTQLPAGPDRCAVRRCPAAGGDRRGVRRRVRGGRGADAGRPGAGPDRVSTASAAAPPPSGDG